MPPATDVTAVSFPAFAIRENFPAPSGNRLFWPGTARRHGDVSTESKEANMNGRKLKVLTTIAWVLTAGEFVSALEIALGKDPWGAGFAVLFGVFFGVATWLLRRGRVSGGAIFAGVLCLFELVEFSSWHKHNALEWTTDSVFALVSLAGLIAVIVVLADRIRHRTAAGTPAV
jgi:hypothetical protein